MSTEDDLKKAAGRLFSKLGSAARDAGKAARRGAQQVTGVGRGTVRVACERTRYAPGDDIKGTVTLALGEPVDAKKLIVHVKATQRAVDFQRVGTVRNLGASTATIYEQTQELDGTRRYESGEHAFVLPLPRDAIAGKAAAPGGKIGDVARAVSSVIAPTTGPVQWKLTATLVIPWGRDLEHAIDLVVDP